MKRILLALIIVSVLTLNSCAMLTPERKQDIKDKIQALIEEYNTPENRDKLAEALQNALRSVQDSKAREQNK